MKLKLYDTQSRTKKIFSPQGKTVQMYVCGPTVYDRAHLGNARSVVIFDLLHRLLIKIYGSICYVRNITDIDDKIIDTAKKNNESIEVLTKRTLKWFHEDMDALGALRPTHEPLATEYIDDMISMIRLLIEKGAAYVTNNQVMFHVKHYEAYGTLSGRAPNTQKAGARVQLDTTKRSPEDFVLWKPALDEEPGWESPWGRGRPGWHIECSAMSHARLDLPLDIHGGGQDLIFPHHENEQAQTCCALDKDVFSHFWVHNGILTVNGSKMSKSLGNFITVPEALARWDGEVVRWVLLSAHYRQPLDWTEQKLTQAKESLNRLYGALQSLAPKEPLNSDLLEGSLFVEALLDDMNTPRAFTHLHEMITLCNQEKDPLKKIAHQKRLSAAAHLVGIGNILPKNWFQGVPRSSLPTTQKRLTAEEIESFIAQRNKARLGKDFQTADKIRDTLKEGGIILEDTNAKTGWKRV